MTDFVTEYQHLSDDELLQVWVERPQLVAEAESALREEIRKRGLAREAGRTVDVWAKPPEQQLAPPVETFINLSVLWFAIRELWLRLQTRRGVPVEAHVEATRRTEPAYRSGARAELRYSYEYQGKVYPGRAVRDFMFNSRAADALVFGHHAGENIMVRIDPDHPSRSYFRSGFGWAEPVLFGAFGLCISAVLMMIGFGIVMR
jgi:Protein of unknown function (DUF3592)